MGPTPGASRDLGGDPWTSSCRQRTIRVASEVRAWLADHPEPGGRVLAEAGYVAPHWPRPWGIDADPVHQLVIDDELRRAGVERPRNMIGIGWAGPTILHAGTDEQKDRYLLPLLAGEEIWCQLFSEPEAGSDLANLATRAVRDGDEYVVTGQKIWTSLAQFARFGILIARTAPDAPKHRGISYFICPMDAEGIEIRPIIEMTGGHTFNEVFFDEVRIPAANLVGAENEGWSLAKVTLGNERVSLSSGGALWGMGPAAGDLVDLVRSAGGVCRSGAPPAARPPARRGRDPPPDPPANRHRGDPRRTPRPGGVGAQDPRRRARSARDGAGQGARGRRRPPDRRRTLRRGSLDVALRLPVLARAHHRGRYRRRAAQHRRRAGAGPSPRRRRRGRPNLGRGPAGRRPGLSSRAPCRPLIRPTAAPGSSGLGPGIACWWSVAAPIALGRRLALWATP
ncbi:MAG: acyl-CoA dehydrogenase family protein [Acidimicrobiia bacterium]|nr:acyl-CoA dehydrogenase family protein [Acidimicrobiia bacterium]